MRRGQGFSNFDFYSCEWHSSAQPSWGIQVLPPVPDWDEEEEVVQTSSLSAAVSFTVQGQKDLPIKGDGSKNAPWELWEIYLNLL